MNKRPEKWRYYFKSFKWVIGNAVFGLAPLFFMGFVVLITEHKLGDNEISHLVHDGTILFVCCAIMGAVWVEYFISSFRTSNMRGRQLVAIMDFLFLY